MKKLWFAFWGVVVISFAILGWIGLRIYQEMPPSPEVVRTAGGAVLCTGTDIREGQNVWQAMGGMEIGSVWGHGSYVAPDWTADYLHREAVWILGAWSAREYGAPYDRLPRESQAALRERLKRLLRANTYDPETGGIRVDSLRIGAFEANVRYYAELFTMGSLPYAIRPGTLSDPARIRKLVSFFFWSSWSASTDRPNAEVTYTSNWPHEPLIGNTPGSDAIVWTGVSILLLLAGIGAMSWYHGALRSRGGGEHRIPDSDPLPRAEPTPSQRAVVKYFRIVSALFMLQIGAGIVTAHFGVEGNSFYGIPLAGFLPYTVARTWHLQLGLFWIAAAWIASGLYIGPMVARREPRGQKLGVNILFGALLLVVLGSLAGEWLSVFHKLGGDAWFLFGHQGYEYVDLGRVWQIALFAGLLLWVFLVGRCVLPVLRGAGEERMLLLLFLVATGAIGLLYAAGLMWGKQTNLAIVEYWRWWVVHLWVEGFFEVFATVVIAFLLARLRLIRSATAGHAVLFSSTVFLAGGIVGTLHHLYFSGTPTAVLALGAVFSALEVVPLAIVGYEAWENIRLARAKEWIGKYKWPVYFFVSVSFWNLVGAGLFGFMINPPVALFYMQGLNTTPVHAHAALFGVYGMLGIGMMLFCLRLLRPADRWRTGPVRASFWLLNIGLAAMVLLSLLPLGLAQTWASVKYGYWYARSAEFFALPHIATLKWLRVVGDTIFAIGALVLTTFVIRLGLANSNKRKSLD